MPRARAVLVSVPPLLAQLLRGALAAHADLPVIAEIADSPEAATQLHALAADAVILGPAADAAALRAFLPAVRVLQLSPDLKRLEGPAPGQSRPLDTANLIAALLG